MKSGDVFMRTHLDGVLVKKRVWNFENAEIPKVVQITTEILFQPSKYRL